MMPKVNLLLTPLVDIALRRHAFGFGVAGIQCAKWINDPSSDGERYREVLQSLFNQATSLITITEVAGGLRRGSCGNRHGHFLAA